MLTLRMLWENKVVAASIALALLSYVAIAACGLALDAEKISMHQAVVALMSVTVLSAACTFVGMRAYFISIAWYQIAREGAGKYPFPRLRGLIASYSQTVGFRVEYYY